ncbi:MAG: DUF2303 family protein [Candidatus Deferrimicrobiaceae bacterium]
MERGDAETIIKEANRLAAVEFKPLARDQVAIVPEGKRLESLKPLMDQYLSRPERRSGTANLESIESLVDHANRFKDQGSALFATAGAQPSLQVVFDYHEQGDPSATARFRQHRGLYKFPLSDEWQTWNRIAGEPMGQEAFAEVLEDRIADILPAEERSDSDLEFAKQLGISLASPTKLLSLSRGLSVKVDQQVAHHTNPASGQGSIAWKEEHSDEAGQPLEIPGGFFLGIPVFKHGDLYCVPVRLRYRVRSQKVTWSIKLHRLDIIFRDAFEDACKHAQAKTELPLFYGTPE